MARYSTSPFLFDEVLNISITDLRKYGYLNPGSISKGTIHWTNHRGQKTSSISIKVHMEGFDNTMTLDYSINGEVYEYDIHLNSIPSNLGKGEVWYFSCPFTWKRCRKLHLISGRFMHRSALRKGMYSCQTQNKKWRLIESVYGAHFDVDKYYQQLHSKHFKKYYSGKPTKRYLKLIHQINKSNQTSISQLKSLFLKKV